MQTESPLDITLYQALSKSDKMDWVIQKSVELGVRRVVPILTEFSQIKLKGEKAEKKRLHWQGVAISACEQSGRQRVPRIEMPENLTMAVQACTAEHRLILHPHQGEKLQKLDIQPGASIALFVGPEGGFSEAEVEQCLQQGFDCVRFGPRVLRTETAPLAILAALQAIWGDC
jgi:16S rRNA (uracil1498-N3)-methyltransferase